jgi:hypothetical protein
MKLFFSSAFTALFALSSLAQTEPYFKAMKSLKNNSTKLESFMLLKKDFPIFQPCGEDFRLVGEYPNPEKEGEMFKIEAFQFVNLKDRAVIQLLFANDRLYAKNVMWFYNADEIAQVQQKYAAMNNNLHANQYLLSTEGGRVVSKEAKTETGDVTFYPVLTQGMDYQEAYVGYEMVYHRKEGKSSYDGFWVYIESYNTIGNPLQLGMTIPTFSHPHATLETVCAAFEAKPANVEVVAKAEPAAEAPVNSMDPGTPKQSTDPEAPMAPAPKPAEKSKK